MNETTTTTKTVTKYIVKIGNPAYSTVDYVFYAEKPALEFYHRTKPTNENVTVIKETVSVETSTTIVI
jgi:phage terminase large subunit-like protein